MTFHKDGQFPVGRETIGMVLDCYGISSFDYMQATSGIQNSTFIITTHDKTYALRVYQHQSKSAADIALEIAFTEHLAAHRVKVPLVYANQAGRKVTAVTAEQRNWDAILMEYIDGEHPAQYSDHLLHEMAATQATIHRLGAQFTYGTPQARALRQITEKAQFIALIDTETVADPRLRDFVRRAAAYELLLPDALPLGYSHFDFDKGNLLVDTGGVITGILDFDDLQYAPMVVCLAYTLWHVLYKTRDLVKVQTYLRTYQTRRDLRKAERSALLSAVLLRHYQVASLQIVNGKVGMASVERYLGIEETLLSARIKL